MDSDAFGPVVNPTGNLPGTPMIDTMSEVSRSFESGFSTNLNGDRRVSINGSLDDSFQSLNSKVGLLRFTEIEGMHPSYLSSTLERKVSNKRRKNFPDSDPIKEVSPDSGQGDEVSLAISLHNADSSSDSSRRRASKQDPELREDPESLFFRDGRRKIDMILCFEEQFDGVMTEVDAKQREQRKVFQENLVTEGLDIETEDKSQSFDEKTFFVKIHLPWRTESRYAEVLNLKLPIKRFITISVKDAVRQNSAISKNRALRKVLKFLTKYWEYFRTITEYDYTLIEKEPSFFSATAGGKPEEQFIVKDRMTHYNSAQRSMIVFQILLRTKFDDGEKCGIRRLINDGTFQSCFPLHEGRYDKPHQSGTIFDRRVIH